MAISVAGVARPKLNQTLDLAVSLISKTVVEDDTNDAFRQRIVLDDLTPDAFTLAGATFTTANGNVTLAAGTSNLRLGDAVTGTGIAANSFVQSITSPTQFVLNNNPSAGGSGATLTITPPTFDATLMIIETSFAGGGSQLTASQKIYLFDGSKAFDADRDGDDEVVPADAVNYSKPLDRMPTTIDVDAFLATARKARTNS